ncbi:GAF and ANTAR domain-containing protein [Thermopolyspora sp. NPDC052614]|uniref:GAF and ANTAR domain-containing protein n=1 Tax=Thermopolyspora sp. NPDC052614 TaxID=3155682 RepID=UPI00343A786D
MSTSDVDALADALIGSLRRLRRPASQRGGVLHHLERALRVVDRPLGYRGASLMFAEENRTLRHLIATDEAARSLERAHKALGQGPCVAVYTENSPVTCSDVTNDPRWPGLARHLHPDVRAVAGVPVRLGRPVGTLNVYDTRPRRWSPSETASLQAYAHVIAQLLDAAARAAEKAELAGQLQHALDHRVAVERAIGYLMGRHRLTAEQAFAALRKEARDSRRRVEDLAVELIERETRHPRPDGRTTHGDGDGDGDGLRPAGAHRDSQRDSQRDAK